MTPLAVSAEVWKVILAPKYIQDLPGGQDMRAFIADSLTAMLDADRDKIYTQTGKTTFKYEVVKSKIE